MNEKQNVGLYRDDRLGIMRNSSCPEIERKRKQIIQISKSCRISMKTKAKLKTVVCFVEILLNLINNTYQPYRKPNSKTVYINKHSNHSLNNLKAKQLIKELQIFQVTTIFFMLQKTHTNKHYARVVLMKNKNIKTKIVRNNFRMRKRGREERRRYGLIHLFL